MVPLKIAIRLNPKNIDAHYSIGWIYNELNRHEAAIDAMGKVLRLDSNHLEARARLNAIQSNLKGISVQNGDLPPAYNMGAEVAD